ncbi:MAG: hypothetical protein E7035_06935 [Verrucomicrobiaceae bacterium]|nr:hypothetical protein [Verrucomicrobiaceae bacterium]
MLNIFTITGNLLAETTATFDFPKEAQTVRAKGKELFQVGGKGINVAKAFFKLSKQKPYAIVFPAGFTGERCLHWMKEKKFATPIAVQIEGETRIGLVCENQKSKKQTTFLGSDIPVPTSAFDQAINKILKLAKKGDVIAFCGSFPNWKKSNTSKIVKLAKQKDLLLCVDTYAQPLLDFAQEDLFLLKINKKEFLTTFTQKALTEKTLSNVANKSKVKNIIVSNSSGKIFASLNGKIVSVNAPKIEREVSATGCGDAMFASLIYEITQKSSLENALKISIARASASAEISATSDWSEMRAKKLLKQIS